MKMQYAGCLSSRAQSDRSALSRSQSGSPVRSAADSDPGSSSGSGGRLLVRSRSGDRRPGRRSRDRFPDRPRESTSADPLDQLGGQVEDQLGRLLSAEPAPAGLGEVDHRLEPVDLLGLDQPGLAEGVDDVGDVFLRESAVAEDAVGAELVEPPLGHLLGVGAGEHLGDGVLPNRPLARATPERTLRITSRPRGVSIGADGGRGERDRRRRAGSCRSGRSGPRPASRVAEVAEDERSPALVALGST